ncbi:MAG: alpha/beta hydrolase [Candidatus Omnitrophica bacterium]|nr:alpha/beta hydrolase [Candidatus Omnitrophota bacterium]
MTIILFILLIIAFLIIFTLGVRFIETKSLFYSIEGITATPELFGLRYEEVYFDTADGVRLYAWFIPRENARFTVIFCHGNAGNISQRLNKISILANMGLNVFPFEYRGYPPSGGHATEWGLYKDTEAAYDYLTTVKKLPPASIIVYGESLGGGPAVHLAQHRPVGALITDGAFSSVKDMMGIAYPFFPYFIFSCRFDSASKIGSVTCPKLIIHSTDDEIVNFPLGQKLFEAAKPPKEFLKIRGSHTTPFFGTEKLYEDGLKKFINNLAG